MYHETLIAKVAHECIEEHLDSGGFEVRLSKAQFGEDEWDILRNSSTEGFEADLNQKLNQYGLSFQESTQSFHKLIVQFQKISRR
jgi:hypothetical protein